MHLHLRISHYASTLKNIFFNVLAKLSAKFTNVNDPCALWIVYTCKFHARFRIKLARFFKKYFFFENQRVSLMQNLQV